MDVIRNRKDKKTRNQRNIYFLLRVVIHDTAVRGRTGTNTREAGGGVFYGGQISVIPWHYCTL